MQGSKEFTFSHDDNFDGVFNEDGEAQSDIISQSLYGNRLFESQYLAALGSLLDGPTTEEDFIGSI